MPDLQTLLQISTRNHSHLCPRQILGVRIGLAGVDALGLGAEFLGSEKNKKRILAIVETDGCFADGVSAATGCCLGHRTMRLEDYGKIAASFIDVKTYQAVRIAPQVDVRQRAYPYAPGVSGHYAAQLQAYQIMPVEELLTITAIRLTTPLERILSRPGVRAECAVCGEEIVNEREIVQNGQVLCRACAEGGYYHTSILASALSMYEFSRE